MMFGFGTAPAAGATGAANPFLTAAATPAASSAAPNPFLAAAAGTPGSAPGGAAAPNPFLAVAAAGASAPAVPAAANPFEVAAAALAAAAAAGGVPASSLAGVETHKMSKQESQEAKDKLASRSAFNPTGTHQVPTQPAGCQTPAELEVHHLLVPHVLGAAKEKRASAPPAAKRGRKGGETSAEAAEGSDKAAVDAKALCVYTWGAGDCDQLGHGDEEYNIDHPRVVARLTRIAIARIATGGLHTLALARDGTLWSWGCNDDGALGRAGAENVPGRVRGALNTVRVAAVAAGDSHSVAVEADSGKVFAWGTYKGADGYLGFDADTRQQRTPRFMDALYKRFGMCTLRVCMRFACQHVYTAHVSV